MSTEPVAADPHPEARAIWVTRYDARAVTVKRIGPVLHDAAVTGTQLAEGPKK